MSTAQRKHRRGSQGRSGLVAAVSILGFLAACSDILDVQLPGVVAESDLSDPKLAPVLVDGVVGDLECAWANYTAASSHHSDEWIPTSGNLNLREWGQRRKTSATIGTGGCGAIYGLFTPLHTARFQAEDVYARLEGFDVADVPDKVNMQGIVRAYGAYALVALGEGFCSVTIDGGPRLTPAEVFAVAEEKFDEAISIASQTGNDTILGMARVGRARMRLNQGNFQGAIDDASLVAPGFLVNASRGSEEGRRYNRTFEFLNDPSRVGSRHGSVADDYRFTTILADGTPSGYLTDPMGNLQPGEVFDSRVRVMTIGEAGFDFVTIHWFHDKYTSRNSPMPIASYKEAQLIIAEAEARRNNLAAAIQVINARRTLAGLPTWNPAAPTQDDVIVAVLEERRRELFQEGGHRLRDMLLFRGTPYEIPFLGEPGSIHPNGLDQAGLQYGSTTCFPMPLLEESGNPNLP